MEKLKIEKTNLEVSRLCIGGCPLGGYGWGNVQKKELLDSVSFAFDNGINFYDTSDTYGLGESEKLLAEALGSNIKNAVICTKFGVRVENGKTFYDNSKEYVFNAIDSSLKRLNRDCVDLYLMHYRDGKTSLEEVQDTMKCLQKQGKIKYYGISNLHKEDEEELKTLSHNGFCCFQDEYSLACRKNESEMFGFRDNFNMTPLTWGSLGQGILTGKYDKNCTFDSNDRRSRDIYVNFHGEKLLKNLKIVDVLKEIAKEVNKSIPAVAIRWILDYLENSVVLAGVKRISQVQSNLEAFGWNLTKEQINRLNEISKD